MKAIKVAGAGLLISWLGALPLGVLNVTAFDLSATQGFQSAILFAIAAIAVELFYVRISLWGSKKWTFSEQWVSPLLLLGGLLLLYLSGLSFFGPTEIGAVNQKPAWQAIVHSPLILGFLLSATNPLQFPFWMSWNKVLTNKNILEEHTGSYSFYMLGIGLGTFLALLLFIWMGGSLVTDYNTYAFYSNKIIGVIYFGFSLYLLFLFYQRNLKPLTK